MIHPLFIAMAKKPGLFLEHADAYSDLVVAEFGSWQSRLKSRATLTVAAVVIGLIGLALAGVAALLAAALPVNTMPMPWLLVVLPVLLLIVAAILGMRVQKLGDDSTFTALREQISLDLATLKILDKEV